MYNFNRDSNQSPLRKPSSGQINEVHKDAVKHDYSSAKDLSVGFVQVKVNSTWRPRRFSLGFSCFLLPADPQEVWSHDLKSILAGSGCHPG